MFEPSFVLGAIIEQLIKLLQALSQYHQSDISEVWATLDSLLSASAFDSFFNGFLLLNLDGLACVTFKYPANKPHRKCQNLSKYAISSAKEVLNS